MDDYDDWVERLDPHARQRFEWMNGRITELTDGWRAADAERDAALGEVERLTGLLREAKSVIFGTLHPQMDGAERQKAQDFLAKPLGL